LIDYNGETKQGHFINVKFYFFSRYVESINNIYMRHNAILLYVSSFPAYWDTNTTVVCEQMMKHIFM